MNFDMTHYIDADRLIHDLEERIYAYSEGYADGDNYRKDAIETLLKDVRYQCSLQQKQPDFPTTDEEIERLLATHPKVEVPQKYKTPDWLWKKQEQPEMDLEKFTEKIKTFQGRYKHPEIISIKGAMAFMARMFYQYPNVARQWYEKLRKVTMD